MSVYVWCILSFNHGLNNFYSPKTAPQKINKEAITLFKFHLLLHVKNWATFHHFFFFHLSFFFIIRVPYEDVLLTIITCRHLSLPYHTQKYFIKAYYYLAQTWHYIKTSLIITKKRILRVFYYVKFPYDMLNKQIKD